jgi:diguanylate cyclase (GGDEF)-like protein
VTQKAITRSSFIPPALVLIVTLAAIVGVTLLVRRADASRQAQLRVGSMTLAVTDLQSAPFNANRGIDVPKTIAARIRFDELTIARGLSSGSHDGVSPKLLATGRASLKELIPDVSAVYAVAVGPGLEAASPRVSVLQKSLTSHARALSVVLVRMNGLDATRASNAREDVVAGAALALLLLLLVFMVFYFRSVAARRAVERLAAENEALLIVSRIEATTDALTGLRNRRELDSALRLAVEASSSSTETMLAFFDLDGFKQYNDSFGHAAGDALLIRIAGRISDVVRGVGSAYRLGGDEFCILAPCGSDGAERLLDNAISALTDVGEDWHVGCSYGAVWIPSEAEDQTEALRIADERMYANKAAHTEPGVASVGGPGPSPRRRIRDGYQASHARP